MPPVALTIAGSDPSGGAGLQADLKTFQRFGVYGEAVVTLITVQNTVRVSRVEVLTPELVVQQLDAVLADIPPQAAKTGALGNEAVVLAVAEAAAAFHFPLIVDPVMISTSRSALIDEAGQRAIRDRLLPRAFLAMPNLDEAEVLAGFPVNDLPSMRSAAGVIRELGSRNVLIKGGHLTGDQAIDILLDESGRFHEFPAPRIATPYTHGDTKGDTHGSGCTYSAAITAELAKGADLQAAIQAAKSFITVAIRTRPRLGRGPGPLNHSA